VIASSVVSSIDRFNAMPTPRAAVLLDACLGVERWVDRVLADRPFADEDALVRTAAAVAATLTPDEVAAALARHPRIGERAGAGHDERFSTSEQSGVDVSERDVSEALAAGNAAYEDRFDRVFLIRAAGRSAEDILAELRRRLDNSDEAELAEVVTQLGEIATLRLRQVVAG
jgi:2-oxo-4-hydroxy-4-carboxy-5-ureidoimidazoline decarboxylase